MRPVMPFVSGLARTLQSMLQYYCIQLQFYERIMVVMFNHILLITLSCHKCRLLFFSEDGVNAHQRTMSTGAVYSMYSYQCTLSQPDIVQTFSLLPQGHRHQNSFDMLISILIKFLSNILDMDHRLVGKLTHHQN